MREGSAAERWDRRWSGRDHDSPPAAFVVDAARVLPSGGKALDVAGGSGRHAIWLAQAGFDVVLVDVSIVALDAARSRARDLGLAVEVVERDLENDGLPPGQWDVVLIHHFLDREILSAVPEVLRPGGVLLFCQPTVRNLERHERPTRRYLLAENELASIAASMPLEPLLLEEGWSVDGRHEARLVARRPG